MQATNAGTLVAARDCLRLAEKEVFQRQASVQMQVQDVADFWPDSDHASTAGLACMSSMCMSSAILAIQFCHALFMFQ